MLIKRRVISHSCFMFLPCTRTIAFLLFLSELHSLTSDPVQNVLTVNSIRDCLRHFFTEFFFPKFLRKILFKLSLNISCVISQSFFYMLHLYRYEHLIFFPNCLVKTPLHRPSKNFRF